MEATLSSKNQVTIPKLVREHLHLKPGDKLRFFMLPDGTVVILPKGPITEVKGSVPKLRRHLPVDEMNEAIERKPTRRSRG